MACQKCQKKTGEVGMGLLGPTDCEFCQALYRNRALLALGIAVAVAGVAYWYFRVKGKEAV